MGYKACKHTVYIVFWPRTRVIKAGYSGKQRWRSFECRGAQVVDLVEFDDYMDAFAFERVVDEELARVCRRQPFRSAQEAIPHLGNGGGGWLECWRLPKGLDPMSVLREADWGAA